ncbi:MAG: lipocalin family protein [Paludibacteraceae bacterium]|nr:lipocalin family protein [Paludibacteraceae bacterium]
MMHADKQTATRHAHHIRAALRLITLCALAMLAVTCGREEPESFDRSDLIGYWQLSGTNQFYHYLNNGTGKFWDEDDDVTEEDIMENGNGYFTWTLSGSTLRLNFVIEINQGGVPKVYNIQTLNSTTLKYKDNASTKTLKRIKK